MAPEVHPTWGPRSCAVGLEGSSVHFSQHCLEHLPGGWVLIRHARRSSRGEQQGGVLVRGAEVINKGSCDHHKGCAGAVLERGAVTIRIGTRNKECSLRCSSAMLHTPYGSRDLVVA
eukprot:6642910-Pyramimonas_sp.AAC.1